MEQLKTQEQHKQQRQPTYCTACMKQCREDQWPVVSTVLITIFVLACILFIDYAIGWFIIGHMIRSTDFWHPTLFETIEFILFGFGIMGFIVIFFSLIGKWIYSCHEATLRHQQPLNQPTIHYQDIPQTITV